MMNAIEGYTMVNKINESSTIKPVETDGRVANKNAPQSQSTESKPQDSVSLSQTSKQLEALMAIIENAPEINAARVAFLRGELDAGRYQIISSQIADRMIAHGEMA